MILIFYLVLLVFFTPFRNSCFVLCNNDKKHLLICRFQYRYTVTKVSALCLLTPIAACRYLAGFPEFRYQTRNPDCHFGIRPNTKYKNNWFIRPDRCSHPARCGIIANCIWWAPLYQPRALLLHIQYRNHIMITVHQFRVCGDPAWNIWTFSKSDSLDSNPH